MMLILWILLFQALFLMFILVLMLFIPIEYYSYGEKAENTSFIAEISWFFKAFRFMAIKRPDKKAYYRISFFGIKPRLAKHVKKQEQKKKIKGNFKRSFDRIFILRTIRFAKEIIKRIKPYKISIDAEYGFDDPSDAAAADLALNLMNIRCKNGNIDLTPVYYDETLSGRFLIRGRKILVFIAIQAIRYMLSGPVRNILFNKRKGRSVWQEMKSRI